MEVHEIKTDTKVLSTKVLFKGKTNKVVNKKYWDSHGHHVDWGTDTMKFDHDVDVEIIEKQIRYNFEYTEPFTATIWDVKVDGKSIEGEVTYYRHSSRQLTLHNCIGAG